MSFRVQIEALRRHAKDLEAQSDAWGDGVRGKVSTATSDCPRTMSRWPAVTCSTRTRECAHGTPSTPARRARPCTSLRACSAGLPTPTATPTASSPTPSEVTSCRSHYRRRFHEAIAVTYKIYADSRSEMIGFVAIFNMRDNEAAGRVVSALDPESGVGFVLPLRGESPSDRFIFGSGVADGHVLGHFVFVTWVERHRGVNPTRPSDPLDEEGLGDARAALSDAREAIIGRSIADP